MAQRQCTELKVVASRSYRRHFLFTCSDTSAVDPEIDRVDRLMLESSHYYRSKSSWSIELIVRLWSRVSRLRVIESTFLHFSGTKRGDQSPNEIASKSSKSSIDHRQHDTTEQQTFTCAKCQHAKESVKVESIDRVGQKLPWIDRLTRLDRFRGLFCCRMYRLAKIHSVTQTDRQTDRPVSIKLWLVRFSSCAWW